MSSLKCMVPLFSAYDRPCYQRLLPTDIADLQKYPDEVVDCLQAGGFTVKLQGQIGHAIALDECHEMCINRDLINGCGKTINGILEENDLFLLL